jgi:hypothetical protein
MLRFKEGEHRRGVLLAFLFVDIPDDAVRFLIRAATPILRVRGLATMVDMSRQVRGILASLVPRRQ